MKRNKFLGLFIASVLLIVGSVAFTHRRPAGDNIISYIADPKDVHLFWKDDNGHIIGSIQHLKDYLDRKNRTLVFAMNGGMFTPDYSPSGLFIRDHKKITRLVTAGGGGNFYLKPNGVFYITGDNRGLICTTPEFVDSGQIKYATQSGPMLVINGTIHPAFKKGSANVNIRNGVGVLPGNKLLFAMSKEEINFYDFAEYFKSMGCQNALYLDGFVSRTYLPEKNWVQTDGDFGVLVGVDVLKK